MTDITAAGHNWKQYNDKNGHMTAFVLEPPKRDEYAGLNFEHHMADGFTIYASDNRGDLVTQRYMGYSKREAARMFRQVLAERNGQ